MDTDFIVLDAARATARQRKRVPVREVLDRYMLSVVLAWRESWEGKDHRYGRDFAAFLGERLMTDYNLRGHEPYPFGAALTADNHRQER